MEPRRLGVRAHAVVATLGALMCRMPHVACHVRAAFNPPHSTHRIQLAARLTSSRLAPMAISTEPNTRFWLRLARALRSRFCRREASQA